MNGDSFFRQGPKTPGNFFLGDYNLTWKDTNGYSAINIMKYCTGNYRLHELSIAASCKHDEYPVLVIKKYEEF